MTSFTACWLWDLDPLPLEFSYISISWFFVQLLKSLIILTIVSFELS
jgi:hypothetical protein